MAVDPGRWPSARGAVRPPMRAAGHLAGCLPAATLAGRGSADGALLGDPLQPPVSLAPTHLELP